MARFNQFAFNGQLINGPNIRIGQITGQFGLPPLRGANWIAQNATGELFVPKLHGGRDIILPLIVRDTPNGISQSIFDMIAGWAATRTQSTLANILDTGTRTAMAECTGWTQTDMTSAGLTFAGLLTFHLADPWFYGPTVSGSVTPNAGLAFGTPVITTLSGPRTTWTAALTGVTSGQPIILVHATQGYATALSSIADTFGGHYAWTRVDGNNTYQDLEIYIGTGGTGTSGTVTVTAPSGIIGGMAVPMIGASTSAGLGAVDVHGNTATFGSAIQMGLTPTASYEAILSAMVGPSPYASYIYGFANAAFNLISANATLNLAYSGTNVGQVAWYMNPTSGAVIYTSVGAGGGASWDMAGLVIKGSGAVVTLSLTHPGSVLAEHLTLDILGPILNPTITNTTNGTSVTINTTVAGTKHLLVDAYAMTALNDGSNVIGSVVHSGATTFLTLNPGVNVLQISGASCTGSTLVTVAFAPGYV